MTDYGRNLVGNKMVNNKVVYLPSVEVSVDTNSKKDVEFLIDLLKKDVIPSIKSGREENEKQIKKLQDELKIINKNGDYAIKDLHMLENALKTLSK